MKIEMYIGFNDYTWELCNIEIPDKTPENKIKEKAEEILYKQLLKEKHGRDVAFSGIYYIFNEDL